MRKTGPFKMVPAKPDVQRKENLKKEALSSTYIHKIKSREKQCKFKTTQYVLQENLGD